MRGMISALREQVNDAFNFMEPAARVAYMKRHFPDNPEVKQGDKKAFALASKNTPHHRTGMGKGKSAKKEGPVV